MVVVVVVVVIGLLISVGNIVVLGGRVKAGKMVDSPERTERVVVVERPESSRLPLLAAPLSWPIEVDSTWLGCEVTVVTGTLVVVTDMAALWLVDGTAVSVGNTSTVEELLPSSNAEELDENSTTESLLGPVDRSVVIGFSSKGVVKNSCSNNSSSVTVSFV